VENMRDNKGQMLILTGITVILISISVVVISSDLSNIEITSNLQQDHPLHLEFLMIKEKIFKLNSNGFLGEDIETAKTNFPIIINEFQNIETKRNIEIIGVFNDDSLPPSITLCLEDSNTKICDTFDIILGEEN
jgi:hypothetical protein